jgi:phosphomannomutase
VSRQQVLDWIEDDVDPAAAAELRELIDRGADAELEDRFAGELTFGTAGLRGPLRAGPNGMNRTVVRRAAAGVATWLTAAGRTGRPVVVCFDARYGSAAFANDSAAILQAAGFDARLLPGPLPTPVLAFSVRHLRAAAGVMVTASHNPPRDNGYKVYDQDGGQIVPPVDREIEAAIRAVPSAKAIPLNEGYARAGEEIVAAYLDAIVPIAPGPAKDIRIVHTALHGVGTPLIERAFAAAGFPAPIVVPEQAAADPDFPTVAFPNPEEPGALDLALALANREGADIVIASDPDADRCGVAVPFPDAGWRMLRGDEVGVLLADHLMRRGVHGTYATTVVSSTLLRTMAADRGVGFGQTLTGFKWIVRAADDLVFGYEEALGYAVLPEVVRDKDGISAALLVADLAAELKASGRTLVDRLAELARRYGLYATDQISVRVTDLSQITETMRRLRTAPPQTLLGATISVEDLLPDADVLIFGWDHGRVVVRPSGTEPKLKCYVEVVVDTGSHTEATRRLEALRAELAPLLGAVTGGAAVYPQVGVACAQLLASVDRFKSLRAASVLPHREIEASAQQVLAELRAPGGPRPVEVDRQLGRLRDSLRRAGDMVNTVDEEQVRTAFVTLNDYYANLAEAWSEHTGRRPLR